MAKIINRKAQSAEQISLPSDSYTGDNLESSFPCNGCIRAVGSILNSNVTRKQAMQSQRIESHRQVPISRKPNTTIGSQNKVK